MKKILYKYRFQLILLVVWLLIRIVINPMGDFPINDDWAYTQNTKILVEQGVYHFSDWPAMTLISQTWWGAIFCKIFGFNLFNLRMATMVLAILSSLTFFKLLKKENENALLSFWITLALMASPFFLGLSFTYMTEIYYLFFAGGMLLMFARIYRNDGILDWLFACIFVVLTVLVRQTGLIFPLGFAFIYLLAKPINWRRVILAILPLAIAYASLEIYKAWRITIDPTMGSMSEIGDLFRQIDELPLMHYVRRIGMIFHQISFGLIPVAFLLFSRLNSTFTLGKWIRFGLVLIPILICMMSAWDFFPLGNMLQDFEMGPRLVKDSELFGENRAEPLSQIVWNCVRILNIVSISLFIKALFSSTSISKAGTSIVHSVRDSIRKRPFFYLMLIIFLEQIVYTTLNPNFFDRYSLPLIFTCLILVGLVFRNVSIKQRNVAIATISIFLVVSSLLLKDLMSWHRARLGATNYLQFDMGVPITKIDGGFEFNAYSTVGGWNPFPVKTTDKSWWFVAEDDYVIANGDLDGYEKFRGFPTHPTISTSSDSVYILKKIQISSDSIPE